MSGRNSGSPLGCLITLAFGALMFYFMFSGDDPVIKKYKEEAAAKYKAFEKKFNYNTDSLSKTIRQYYDHDPSKIHGKCIVLYGDTEGYSLNLGIMSHDDGAREGYRLPIDLIAYKLRDLSTIVIEKRETVTTSSWSGPRIEKEQVRLAFYDVHSSKFLFDTLMIPDGTPFIHKSRRTTVHTYSFTNAQIVNVIEEKLQQP